MPTELVALPIAGWADPEWLFAAHESHAADAWWLDAGPHARDGWSYLGEGSPVREAAAVRAVRCDARDAAETPEAPWPAGPFRGGWVGWISYEGEQLWLRADRYVAFDHARARMWAVAPAAEAAQWARVVTARVDAAASPTWSPPAPAVATSRHTADDYAELIARCRAAIFEGDAYQLCLTTRFDVATSESVDAAAAYARLRHATPAHHGGFVRSGDTALLSASPEQFLTTRDGVARTKPIKGTRPRGADPASDAALAAELRASPKEQAENVMIVDLMRNDLSRVSDVGSIRVDALLEVESYAAVHQLVSTVAGTLRSGTTVGELLDACFPAGSMTGAPKLSAMAILRGLEGAPRGVYSGCFGYIGSDGAIDLAMVIRTIVTHPGGAYVGAGGGITWGSDAAAEVAEVGIKARAPLAVLGAALPLGW